MNSIEINKLIEFIEFYKEHHDRISKVEENIKILSNNASILLTELQEKREEEESFMNELSCKYTEDEIKQSLSELKTY